MTDRYNSAVAVIGMSGKFPGAGTVDELWSNLADGKSGLRPVTDEELAASYADPAVTTDPHYVRVSAPLDGVGLFDPSVFGFTPTEAEVTDPQHRLFLECAWQAVEEAGYLPTEVPGEVGVFAGCGFPAYMVRNAAHIAEEPGGSLRLWVGNERDSLTSLVSYKLGFRGPSVDVQSFCSTSLVAVHMAAQSLLTFECDVALAGGVYVDLAQPSGYLYEEGGIAAPDGVVRSFDAGATGTVMGNGVGVVVLKRMTEALADGDQIHAVILGSAMNNDGRARAGYTAPGVDGEAAVIETAIGIAGVPPESIGYLECHATGTMLGDSIELAAMSRAFPPRSSEPCVLGSLKPSLGHLDRAAGVAGLIRTAYALRYQVLPGTPNFRTPNRALASAADRFRVLDSAIPWPAGDTPRRAGVTSFGLGGTNAHVVMEEAPSRPYHQGQPGPQLLVLSARSATALDAATEELRRHLDLHRELVLADVAFTLQQSRTGFPLRRAVVVRDHDDAIGALKDRGRWLDGATRNSDPEVFLHAGDEPEEAVATRVRAFARLGVEVRAVRIPEPDGADEQGVPAVHLSLPGGDEPAEEWFLRQLAMLWQAGARPVWAELHDDHRQRVSLPTYPFQRQRYWVEPPAAGTSGQATEILPQEEWTNVASWRWRPLVGRGTAEQLRAAGPWLVYTAEDCGDAVVRGLRDAGAAVTVVRPGEGFESTSAGEFRVRPDDRADHERLLSRLPAAPRTVVHGFSLVSQQEPHWLDTFDRQQTRGFYSVLALTGALAERPDPQPVDLVLLTEGATRVPGSATSRPECATLVGLAPTLAQENPGLSCRVVDVDAGAAARGSCLARLAGQILAEAVGEHIGPVALRDGQRWTRDYERLPLPSAASGVRPIPRGGTVLITGGLGDVGLIIARHLAATRHCRLVLTARSPLPPRADWARFMDTRGGSGDRSTRHVRSILALERQGAEVMAVSADVGDAAEMARVVDTARKRFGSIDAVVHGAGVSDAQYFATAHELDRAGCEAHFRAKVHGFHALQDALGDDTGLRVTLSSLSAVLGGIRLGPYAAANAALDAYALEARAGGAGSWLTVDWDTWRTRDDQRNEMGSGASAFEMAPAQGVDVLERAMPAAAEIGQLVISTHSIDARLAQWVSGSGEVAAADIASDRGKHPRPVLSTPYVEPRDEVEEGLSSAWSAVLGLERVGAEDNFFELGGNSLIAMQLMGRVRKQLRASGPVTAVLEHPTVRELAAVLRFPGNGQQATKGSGEA